jgi:hypothetical protein
MALTAAVIAVGAFLLFRPSSEPAVPLELKSIFSSITERGAMYAPSTLELRNKNVQINGYAAADPNIPDRFVLTQTRKTVCSPCDEAADYPASITVIFPNAETEAVPISTDSVFVYLANGQKVPQTGEAIEITGQLELNQSTDDKTRFSSLVQLRNATWQIKKK